MSNPRVGFLLARTDTGALVGVATVKQSDAARTVSVLRLYVLRDYQGQGIGSQLLDRALAAFPDAQRIELQVAEWKPLGPVLLDEARLSVVAGARRARSLTLGVMPRLADAALVDRPLGMAGLI
jgi:ribosomal protein S18 acetylase RimI-like enzyme